MVGLKRELVDKITNYVLLFLTFSFIGYLWEVGIKLVMMGILVNSGTLYGPWIPIYGFGGLFVLFFLKRFKEKPFIVFILSLLICTSLEYFIGYYLEATKGMRWWHYSNYLININGRVCLEGAIIFGLAGCVVIYIAEPFFTKLFAKIPYLVKIIVATILIALFITDFIYVQSHPNIGEGITFNEKT